MVDNFPLYSARAATPLELHLILYSGLVAGWMTDPWTLACTRQKMPGLSFLERGARTDVLTVKKAPKIGVKTVCCRPEDGHEMRLKETCDAIVG